MKIKGNGVTGGLDDRNKAARQCRSREQVGDGKGYREVQDAEAQRLPERAFPARMATVHGRKVFHVDKRLSGKVVAVSTRYGW